MPKNSPDEPELPRLPDFPPADPPAGEPDVEPELPLSPAAEADQNTYVDDHDGDTDDTGAQRAHRGDVDGKRVLLAIGAVVAVVLVLAGGIHLLSGGSDSTASPADAVRDYFNASKAEDCNRLVDLIVEKSWSAGGRVSRDKAIAMCEREAKAAPALNASLDKVKVLQQKDDLAVVKATVTVEKRHRSVSINLARERGAWKIAGV